MYKNIKVDPPTSSEAKILLWEPVQTVHFWNYTRQNFQHWRLYLNDSEGAFVNQIPLKTDEIVLIPPGMITALSLSRPFRHFYIHFQTGELYNSCPRKLFRFPRSAFGDLPEQLLQLKADDELEYVRTCLYAAIFSSLRMIPRTEFHKQEKSMDSRIAAARNYIQQHIGESLENREIGKRFGLSVNRFIRLFRDEIGIPPQQYQQSLRIEQAMQMLKENKKSIDEIADILGFTDRFHFSRVFRRITGCPPGRYRRCIKNNPAE